MSASAQRLRPKGILGEKGGPARRESCFRTCGATRSGHAPNCRGLSIRVDVPILRWRTGNLDKIMQRYQILKWPGLMGIFLLVTFCGSAAEAHKTAEAVMLKEGKLLFVQDG